MNWKNQILGTFYSCFQNNNTFLSDSSSSESFINENKEEENLFDKIDSNLGIINPQNEIIEEKIFIPKPPNNNIIREVKQNWNSFPNKIEILTKKHKKELKELNLEYMSNPRKKIFSKESKRIEELNYQKLKLEKLQMNQDIKLINNLIKKEKEEENKLINIQYNIQYKRSRNLLIQKQKKELENIIFKEKELKIKKKTTSNQILRPKIY